MDLAAQLELLAPSMLAMQEAVKLENRASPVEAAEAVETQEPSPSSPSVLAMPSLPTPTPLPVNPLENIERPSLSYKDLIIEAIESSPEKRLKLNEIYQVIRVLHPYYRLRPDQWGWQNSIRHNLSLHDCFVKLPLKQTSASGVVGHYWTVVPELSDKQTLRRRSRAAARAAANRQAKQVEARSDEATTSGSDSSPSPVAPSPIELPKPTASYGGLDALLGLGEYKNYSQQLLNAYIYQQNLINSITQLAELAAAQQVQQPVSPPASATPPETPTLPLLQQQLLQLNPLLALSHIATAQAAASPEIKQEFV